MNQLLDVLWYALVLLAVVMVGLAVFAWLQVRRNDDLEADLSRVTAERDEARGERDAARYQAARLERRLARIERDDVARSRRGYVDMSTRINGERVW